MVEEAGVADEVPTPEAARLGGEPEEPLESAALQPCGSLAFAARDEIEGGINYIIDGHNARVSMFYQSGDIATKGLNYSPGASGSSVGAFKIAVQLQL